MTNLNKEKEEIIYELVLSLNKGNSCYASERVEIAIEQYNRLLENGIITEWCEHDWKPKEYRYDSSTSTYEYEHICTKCGETKIGKFPFCND